MFILVMVGLYGCGGSSSSGHPFEGQLTGTYLGLDTSERGDATIVVTSRGDMPLSLSTSAGALPMQGSVDHRGNFTTSASAGGEIATATGSLQRDRTGVLGTFTFRFRGSAARYRLDMFEVRSVKPPSTSEGPAGPLAETAKSL